MRYITADYILTENGEFKPNLVVSISENNIITNIDSTAKEYFNNIETYSGVIVPSFINAHCHLELSHLKNKIPKGSGLVNFIKKISHLRDTENSISAIEQAHIEMANNGIIAVGDISNSSQSFNTKKKSKNIKYFTFIEVLGLKPENCERQYKKGVELYNLYDFSHHKNIVPHAPYDVHPDLFRLIKKSSERNQNAIISIHNQEDESENLMFSNKKGDLISFFTNNNILCNFIQNGYDSSIDYTLENINIDKTINILLVHNIYTTKRDIEKIKKSSQKIFWIFCPNSNLYIENKLPNIDIFYKEGLDVAIGTDSYASNTELSILSEIKTINSSFSNIPIPILFKWATIGGARALNFDKEFGSIEVGKKCGLNLIQGINLKNNCIKNASLTRLVYG